jgi:hypothetical protein
VLKAVEEVVALVGMVAQRTLFMGSITLAPLAGLVVKALVLVKLRQPVGNPVLEVDMQQHLVAVVAVDMVLMLMYQAVKLAELLVAV